jgi:hypothetical protein
MSARTKLSRGFLHVDAFAVALSKATLSNAFPRSLT